MIKVDTYKYIEDLHVKERQSICQISREVGLSRQTIRKILYGSVEETTMYKRKVEAPAPLRNQFEPTIKQWLIDDQKNSATIANKFLTNAGRTRIIYRVLFAVETKCLAFYHNT